MTGDGGGGVRMVGLGATNIQPVISSVCDAHQPDLPPKAAC